VLTFSPTTGPRQLEFKPSELTGEGGGVAMTTGAAAIAAASSHCHPIGRFIVTQHRVVFGATRWPKKHRLSLNYPWFRDFVVMIIFFLLFPLLLWHELMNLVLFVTRWIRWNQVDCFNGSKSQCGSLTGFRRFVKDSVAIQWLWLRPLSQRVDDGAARGLAGGWDGMLRGFFSHSKLVPVVFLLMG